MRRTGQKLGQHFLNAEWVARDLIASLHIQSSDIILEIGPGKGALTKKLLETGARVVAVEKDPALVVELREIFDAQLQAGQLTLLEVDVRDFQPEENGLGAGKYVLAANIPYYITGEIIRKFLETDVQPRAMALLIQKEVAERIVARNGKESILSISVKVYGTPSIVAKVPAGCFNPPPSVDSAILLVKDISKTQFANVSESDFFKVLKAGFAARRKLLSNNLKVVFENPQAHLEAASILIKARAEDLELQQWLRLTQNY